MYLSLNQEQLWQVLRFLIIFNVMAAPLYLIAALNINLYPLELIERDQTSFFLSIIGVKHSSIDFEGMPSIELSNGELIAIGEACTAWRSILAFIALVAASPRQWSSKKKALIGIPVIYAVNILRLVGISLVALTIPSITEFIHTILWREGLMILIFVLWYYWFRQAQA